MATLKIVLFYMTYIQCTQYYSISASTGASYAASNGYTNHVGGSYIAKCYTDNTADVISWVKISTTETAGTEYNITESGKILYPFNSTGRYSLNESVPTTGQDKGKKVAVLRIKDLQNEDTAKIKCKVATAVFTFSVDVVSPILGVSVTRGPSIKPFIRYGNGATITLDPTNTSDVLGCEVLGGRKTPSVNLTLDGMNIATRSRHTVVVHHGIAGLSAVKVTVRKSVDSQYFKPDVTYNGKNFTCVAVSGATERYPDPVTASAILKVQGEAYITCMEMQSSIECNVTANPTPFCSWCSVTWTWTNSSVEVPLGSTSNSTLDGHEAQAKYVDSVAELYEVSLTLPKNKAKHYVLHVVNAMGSSRHDVFIKPTTSMGSRLQMTPLVFIWLMIWFSARYM